MRQVVVKQYSGLVFAFILEGSAEVKGIYPF